MGQVARWGGSVSRSQGRGRRRPPITLNGLGSALATIVALAIGTVLAVVFAATLAVVLALATVLLALAALTWRLRPQPKPLLVHARKAGHSWVAYDWDRKAR